MTKSTSPRRVLAGALAGIAVLAAGSAVGACGSTNKTSAGAADAASTAKTSSAAADGGMAAAQRIVAAAATGAVFGPGAGDIPADQVTAAKQAAIKPFAFKPGGAPKSVIVVPCGPTVTCIHEGDLMAAAVKALGWRSQVIRPNELTAAADQASWNTALGRKPDAIITIGIAAGAIGPQLARAKREGVYTVMVNGTKKGGSGFDAYVGGGWSLSHAVLGAKMIVDTKGKGTIAYFQTPEIPELGPVQGANFTRQTCTTCHVILENQPVLSVLDPVKMGQLATSTVRKHPDLDYFVNISTDVQVKAASQAFRGAGSKAQNLGAGLNGPSAMAVLNSGDVPFIVGPPQEWVALQAVDAVLRGVAGKPGVAPEDATLGVYLMTKDNAPDNPDATEGPVDRWAVQQFDFVAPYSQAWGVDLSSLVAKVK